VESAIYINCDGGARGNPGPAASAFVVKKEGKGIYKQQKYLGKTTNNVAEYQAVISALKWLTENKKIAGGADIIFLLDSELITKQLMGIYKTKNPTLKKLFTSAKLLEQGLSNKIYYKRIPREKNMDADYLVNTVLRNY